MIAKQSSSLENKLPVLLVEDYEPNIQMISAFLQELGYMYEVARNGDEVITQFSAAKYAAILMDIQLPDMDGITVSRKIRILEKEKVLSPTPIIGMTGHATADDKFFCLQAGMNDFIAKPFEIEGLESILQRVLKAR
jgi:CheY-like chemotaxis protein